LAAPSGAGGSAGLGSAYWHLGWQCVALRRERVVPRPLWAPTPPTAFVSTKSRREVAKKCTPCCPGTTGRSYGQVHAPSWPSWRRVRPIRRSRRFAGGA